MNYNGIYPTSGKECELYFPSATAVKVGLCSNSTIQLLEDQENCAQPIWSEKFSIFLTTDQLIESLCGYNTWIAFYPVDRRRRIKRINKPNKENKKNDQDNAALGHLEIKYNRLNPLEFIEEFLIDEVTLANIPRFENTRHRYPWLCSLRGNV